MKKEREEARVERERSGKNRWTGDVRIGSAVAPRESPSGRDVARAPKCPRGCTADSYWTQKGHTGGSLTATYTKRATRLIRNARAVLRVRTECPAKLPCVP